MHKSGSLIISVAAVVFAFAAPAHAYRMSIWVPAWDTKALASMQTNGGKVDETNPTWYQIATDGTFTKSYNAESADFRAAFTGTDIIPTIQNYLGGKWDRATLGAILASSDLREKHAEALTQLVVQQAYAGIDIDYESKTADMRDNFTTFVQLLASKLHTAGKKLSITLAAKTSDSDNWSGPAGEDWRAIGAAADYLKVMAYDNHWDGSAAGAIAPINWINSIATYAEANVPVQKVIIGLPWYGYDWQGTNAADLTYVDALALVQKVGAQVTYDANGEATFAYSGHTVYYQDAKSYAQKLDAVIAKHPKIGGFAHWRAGGEDPAMWQSVARLRNSSSSPATPISVSFVVGGSTTLNATAGRATQSTFTLTPINGWTGTANATVQQIDAFPGTVTITQTASAGSPATLVVNPNASAAGGQYKVKVRMTSGTLSSELQVTIVLQALSGKRRAAHH